MIDTNTLVRVESGVLPDTSPVRLWTENFNGPMDLRVMLQVYAHRLLQVSHLLDTVSSRLLKKKLC